MAAYAVINDDVDKVGSEYKVDTKAVRLIRVKPLKPRLGARKPQDDGVIIRLIAEEVAGVRETGMAKERTIVLLSGDGDFADVVNRARAVGCDVQLWSFGRTPNFNHTSKVWWEMDEKKNKNIGKFEMVDMADDIDHITKPRDATYRSGDTVTFVPNMMSSDSSASPSDESVHKKGTILDSRGGSGGWKGVQKECSVGTPFHENRTRAEFLPVVTMGCSRGGKVLKCSNLCASICFCQYNCCCCGHQGCSYVCRCH